MAGVGCIWVESYGAGPTLYPTDLPTPATPLDNLDFLGGASGGVSSQGNSILYKSHPITVPSSGTGYSWEKWVRTYFNFAANPGTNQVAEGKFWRSDSETLSHASLAIKMTSRTAYATPVQTASTFATSDVPTSEPQDQGVGAALGQIKLGGAGTNSDGTSARTATGYSDYIVLQLHVPSTVDVPGDIVPGGDIEYTFQYDES